MSEPHRIESPGNPKIKKWRALQERRARDRSGQFIVEGSREVARAIAGGIVVMTILTSESPTAESSETAARCADRGADHFELSPAALQRVSRRQRPPDIVAIAEQPTWDLGSLELAAPSLVMIAEAIEKPGNLGAMMRSADGAGADALVVSDPATDLANPNVIRASQGALFALPVAAAPAAEVLRWVGEHGLHVLVASGGAPTALWRADLTQPVAFVIGSEDLGVSAHWRGRDAVAIPMAGVSDSLNASVAAAVCLYEAVRQRRAGRAAQS